jgi:hypothetical protein
MSRLSGFIFAIMVMTISACQSTPPPQIVVEPFFPAPPRLLMEPPPELETISDEPERQND